MKKDTTEELSRILSWADCDELFPYQNKFWKKTLNFASSILSNDNTYARLKNSQLIYNRENQPYDAGGNPR